MTEDPVSEFTTERMTGAFSSRSRVGAMLRFEAALAGAEARAGVVPAEAARAIAETCEVDRFDVSALLRDARRDGNLAIPLVRRLTELVPERARGFVHWGATSQDAIDTGMVLQAKEGLDILVDDLLTLGAACASLAEEHAATPMVGRTLLQHALPITFGFKVARWLAPVTGRLERLVDIRGGLPVQLGGAAGTLGALGQDGPRVARLLAEELGLVLPDLPWHTDRTPVAELAAALGVTAGAVANIATDVVLLMQPEVGEVAEGGPDGPGRSSTMPQKRNPVHAPAVIASARLAVGLVPVVLSGMVQEHERSVGAWQAEWVVVPELFRSTGAAVGGAVEMVKNLEVDPGRMRENLESDGGSVMAEALVMALARHVGRHEAFEMVGEASALARVEGIDLGRAAEQEERVRSVLSPERIREALDPAGYLGASQEFVRRAADRYRAVAASARRT